MADGPLGPWTSGTCSGVAIPVGSDIQGILNSKPGGTTFCFAKGVHRLKAPLTPKANQTLAAQPGAVLDGSLVLRGWSGAPGRWVHSGGLPAAYTMNGNCEDQAASDCTKAEQVFRNGTKLTRVNSVSALRPKTFFTYYAANKIYVYDDPRTVTMELSKTRRAIQATAGGVTLLNLTIRKFASESGRRASRRVEGPPSRRWHRGRPPQGSAGSGPPNACRESPSGVATPTFAPVRRR